MSWCDQMLAYFTAEQRHFVVRAWWGARLVIDLQQFRPIDAPELTQELHRTECAIISAGLQQLVAETENGAQPEYDSPSTDRLHCTVGTLVHFPGLLGLVEAIPWLRVLEARLVGGGHLWGRYRYAFHLGRKLTQIALRRLGQAPRGYPALTFLDSEEREPLRTPQPGPIDGPTRHANLSLVRKGAALAEVYRLLGAPDEIGGGQRSGVGFWRYDIDHVSPYTVLLWLGENEAVKRMVRYLPPFWAGPDLFPSRNHSLLNSDGTTVDALANELDNGTFKGTRIEVDVLQEIESSRHEPMASLARAALDDVDALGPLVDALKEAGDPRADQIRATHGVPATPLP
jgi:hypothetical protein